MSIFLNNKKYQILTSKDGKLTRVSFPSHFWSVPQKNTVISSVGTNVGIFSATLCDGFETIRVSWGDGNVQEFSGSVSLASHVYAHETEANIQISNTVSELRICGDGQNGFVRSIPNMGSNVRIIKGGCFNKCQNLTTVCFGTGVETIEQNCFVDCPNLQYVEFDGKDQADITGMQNYSMWFSGCDQTKLVFWKKGNGSGCFAYGYESAVLMADDEGNLRIISDDNNNFIDKE